MNEELEHIKLSLENGKHAADVKRNPVVESLLSPVKKIPYIGSLVNSAVERKLSEFQQRKEQELLEIICQNEHLITSDMVNDVEFIINFDRILEAVMRLASNDKIQFFGNLIRNGYLSGEHIENSEFEEYLNILNTLSYREIIYLADFVEESSNSNGKIINGSWNNFIEKMNSKNKVKNASLWFKRLENTGFIKEVISVAEYADAIITLDPKCVGYEADESLIRFYDMTLKADDLEI